MVSNRPSVRGELPWLSGPLHRVRNDAWPLVDDFLERWSYRRITLDGRAMTSHEAAHAQLHAAFDFPDWCGANWDAFDDCFGHFVHQNDGALIAVVWRDMDVAARHAPATAAEVGWGLLSCKYGTMPSLPAGAEWAVDLDVFVVGDGPDFRHPG
ncbi:hypothetical protein GCM10023340_04870 [Nocardioides marinquilinus]|uniref:Barstar (barnase inhibitor) domain-containing protein n=1 Tax=Nocardioides marinquilinus TaxID=1210400 RepID=A0ABP9P7S9_9ACTN